MMSQEKGRVTSLLFQSLTQLSAGLLALPSLPEWFDPLTELSDFVLVFKNLIKM